MLAFEKVQEHAQSHDRHSNLVSTGSSWTDAEHNVGTSIAQFKHLFKKQDVASVKAMTAILTK